MKTRCMIVDDEPLARQVLRGYIGSIESLELMKECGSSSEAASYLHEENIDLMFLDIKMPGLSGMDFLRTLTNAPVVVITTAFSEYALEGYEYSIADYLLKPFSFERFLKAVNKAIDRIRTVAAKNFPSKMGSEDYIFLKSDKSDIKVKLKEIRYFEAYGNYVKVHTAEKTILVSQTMKSIEADLPSGNFLRVHKSFIVSFAMIDKVEGNLIKINDREIPVGKYYKLSLENAMKEFRIGK